MTKCKRCNGKGWGPWRMEYGRCWLCNGTGQIPEGVVTTTSRVAYGPSLKARRRGQDVRIVAEYTREAEVKGSRAIERTTRLHIRGTGIDGKAVDRIYTTAEAIAAAEARLNQSDWLIPDY